MNKKILFLLCAVFAAFTSVVQSNLFAAATFNWTNVSVGGGGYITGLIIHPTNSNVICA